MAFSPIRFPVPSRMIPMIMRRWLGGAVIMAGGLSCPADALSAPSSLTVGDGFVHPLGFHDPSPSFSWKLPVGVVAQTAYRVEVRDAQSGEEVWNSGWVESAQSVHVPHGGAELASRQRLIWRVQVRDDEGAELAWSEPGAFEIGLLTAADWQAQWIRPPGEPDPDLEQVAWLRRSFDLDHPIERARLYVTARGLFEIQLNGEKVGADYFVPGWTSYKKRIDTLTYDVTNQLQEGENTLMALLGEGWYAGHIGYKEERWRYGKQPELLLQLEITFADGRTETIVSDGGWEATRDGPILSSSIYDGEVYDARRVPSGWQPVVANADLGPAFLEPKPSAPVRATEFLPTRAITEPEPGRFVFDLGQNMVGWARLKIPVEQDKTVTMRVAEILNPDGTLYTLSYREAKSTNHYTAAETGEIEWEPTFTFHGFRYVELSGLPEGVEPQKDWVTGAVLHSDLVPTGTFTSSHEKLNQLQSNIVWGQRGNFLEIPTDCPQRNERLGWTGDAQVFASTAMFNYDCAAFYKSWLRTLRDEQNADGRIPNFVPLGGGGSPGWMDAATIIPWSIYLRTGDKEVLSENFAMMEKLVGWYRGRAGDDHLIEEIAGFGDWLQPYPVIKKNIGDTPLPLIGNAFHAHSARILAQAADVIGRPAEERERLAAGAAAVRGAFTAHYFDADGRLKNATETQTGYLLAIAFDLIPEELQKKAGEHLVRLIEEAGGHLRTGFLGTPLIAAGLDSVGHPDVALSVLFKEAYPSWLFSVNQGATTMWERWDSYRHDGGISGNHRMNSFNHYAYGAIGQWLYERLAGLKPDPVHPGYKHFFIRPLIAPQLESAAAELETPYGKAASRWTRKGDTVIMEIVVPPNTTATIEFPDGRAGETVTPGVHRYQLKVRAPMGGDRAESVSSILFPTGNLL